ncbi:hypothetical protein H4R23_003602 [Coemansia sp. Cherry 401B]|nr:hypothetical protein H4R23_003602 [Coemansia sp. Cherry 401B]
MEGVAKKFKYDLDALEWDDQHRRNKEGVYCYCGLDYNDGDPMLHCEGCQQLFHWDCVSCLKAKPLRGDIFYRFKCSVCTAGGEEYERDMLSWVQVIYLALYHLSTGDPGKKYFRWRENICATINDNWSSLYPGKSKTATWQNTVAGCLSTHSALFKSGFEDTQQSGNWTLHEVVAPTRERFKGPTKAAKRTRRKEATGAEQEILAVLSEGKAKRGARHRVSFSDDEDEERRARGKRRRQNMKALENDSELLQSVELFTQLERQRQDTGPGAEDKGAPGELGKHAVAVHHGFEGVGARPVSKSETFHRAGNDGEAPSAAAVGDSKGEGLESVGEPGTGAVEIRRTDLGDIAPQPMLGESADCAAALMSERAQWDVLERIGGSSAAMGVGAARRLRRRLQLRRLKRMLGLPIFDIDRAVGALSGRRQQTWDAAGAPDASNDVKPAGAERSEAAARSGAACETLERACDAGATAAIGAEPHEAAGTPYAHSFASRLLGRAVLRDSLTAAGARISPFHGRLLRPFIWRDSRAMAAGGGQGQRAELPMLRVLRAIRGREHRMFAARGMPPVAQADHETIDYVHFQQAHVAQVNGLLGRTFWPHIDVSEALQYPEFSVVALYGRRVIGCAFLTPDAYLTYIAVAAGWEGGGIAKYMVYHLTQTVPTKDVTLHVSATNVAMLLYQRLGFKPETYAAGFYRAYLPAASRECPNAFFMRLRRY